MEKQNNRRSVFFIIFILLCIHSVAAAPARITFQLDNPLSASQTPYYLALANGSYKAAGLDVNLVPGSGPGSSIQAVNAGRADIGTADMTDVLAWRARGMSLVIVATAGDRNPACVFFTEASGIRTAADLSGKKIAFDPFDLRRALFPLFSRGAGVREQDITFIPMAFSRRLLALSTGSVDAILGTVQERQEIVQALGENAVQDLLWADNGFELYGDCLFIRQSSLSSKAPAFRSFINASLKGWARALSHPDEAVAALGMYRTVGHDDALTLAVGLEDLAPLFDTPAYRTRGIGSIEEARVAATIDALSRYDGVPAALKPSDVVTRVLLPAAPVKMPAAPPVTGTPPGSP